MNVEELLGKLAQFPKNAEIQVNFDSNTIFAFNANVEGVCCDADANIVAIDCHDAVLFGDKRANK